MTHPDLVDLEFMTRFRTAYGAIDAAALKIILAPNFEWHLNWFPADNPVPTGKILRGLDAMIAELHLRKRSWSMVRFQGLQERFLPGLVVQTFTISGIDQNGRAFEVAAVDLYTIESGLMAKKDTYWKFGQA